MSLYWFTDIPPAPAPQPPTPTPQPVTPCDSFASEGCFADLKSARIMDHAAFGAETMSAEVSVLDIIKRGYLSSAEYHSFVRDISEPTFALVVTSQICFGVCNDGVYTYFGTQFGNEVSIFGYLRGMGDKLNLKLGDCACSR